MSKKQKRKQAQARRQRELERLQKTIEEQRVAPPPRPSEPEPEPGPPAIAPVARFPEPVDEVEDELWDSFEEATLDDKMAIFLDALEAGELDEGYAFDMLSTIREELDRRDPGARARYAELLERLRRQAPELYDKSATYYCENLINDAIADGRWERLPELLAPFAKGDDLDMFFLVIDRLTYHGQLRPLIQAMSAAWPTVSKSDKFFEWGIEEFGSELMLLYFFDYLETTPSPRADDPALLEATAPYGQWREGWLERAIPRLTAPGPSAWQPANFGPTVDADQWQENLYDLLLEFMADRHRAGIPYSRAHMALTQLATVLEKQFNAPAKARGKSGKKKGKSRPSGSMSPLVPNDRVLDKSLAELIPFIGGRPYTAVATLELLPAYLHFVARLGLIHPTEMDAALAASSHLVREIQPALQYYETDPRAVDALQAAWSEEALSALRNDPALAQARATPPAPPPPAPEPPPRRPGALQTYTFKVTYLRDPDVWRTIEIAENQTLDDLHRAIQNAVDFDADHLYSFFMSGRAWDDETEYASPHAQGRSAARVRIGDLNLRMKQRFLYLFDYGDEHHFEVQLVAVNPDAPKGRYPRVVERHGKNPPQYDLDWEEEEWDEDEDWEEGLDEEIDDD